MLLLVGNVACGASPGLSDASRCAALAVQMVGKWPDPSTHILSASVVGPGPVRSSSTGNSPANAPLVAPEHCEVTGLVQERVAEDGQHYAIRFHLRMPIKWNGRFFFQGGGGSNGEVGDALGTYSSVAAPALMQGFAVVSQDSGHDNRLNNDPSRGGALVFGFDEQARTNYGHASLPIVANLAKSLIFAFYRAPPRYSYFVGCSKGGQEGLAFAERYPGEFDGIVAAAPGLALPRAAVEEAWDTQSFASVSGDPNRGTMTLGELSKAFSESDLDLVRDAVLSACDADDGLKDGIVGAFAQCSTAKVLPELNARRCSGGKMSGCLAERQIEAMTRVVGGARNRQGEPLYGDWPWDAGIAASGWRTWKLGGADGRPPSLNVILGGASLASVFITPPVALPADPQRLLDFMLAFDFDHDAPGIYATTAAFSRSSWDDIAARSVDLKEFRARRGRLIIPHGASDPVFSINDTVAWWQGVDRQAAGKAADFVRVFPVPGMNHCSGGPATDEFDPLTPLVNWVEHSRAPDRIIASANRHSPWPARSRPLCAYPAIARYTGGNIDRADSFVCQ